MTISERREIGTHRVAVACDRARKVEQINLVRTLEEVHFVLERALGRDPRPLLAWKMVLRGMV